MLRFLSWGLVLLVAILTVCRAAPRAPGVAGILDDAASSRSLARLAERAVGGVGATAAATLDGPDPNVPGRVRFAAELPACGQAPRPYVASSRPVLGRPLEVLVDPWGLPRQGGRYDDLRCWVLFDVAIANAPVELPGGCRCWLDPRTAAVWSFTGSAAFDDGIARRSGGGRDIRFATVLVDDARLLGIGVRVQVVALDPAGDWRTSPVLVIEPGRR